MVLVKIRYREWRMKSPPPVPVCDLIVTVRDRPELGVSHHFFDVVTRGSRLKIDWCFANWMLF